MIENYGVESFDYDYNDDADRTQKKKPRKFKFKNFIAAALLCTVAITVTYRYVRITRLNYEINKMESELSTLMGNNQNLNVKVAKTENLTTIEKTAISKLHMHKPTEENIVYVNVNNYNIAKAKPADIRNDNPDFGNFFVKVFGVITR